MILSGPCPAPVEPAQLMRVGVIVEVQVGRGVRLGVKVSVGGCVFVIVEMIGVMAEYVGRVAVNTKVCVGVLVWRGVGVREGVLVSAENPVGSADPMIGMEMIKVRALDYTISSGSIGTIEMIGS